MVNLLALKLVFVNVGVNRRDIVELSPVILIVASNSPRLESSERVLTYPYSFI